VKTTSSWWGIPRSGEYTADKTVRSHRVRVENIGAGDTVSTDEEKSGPTN
jgi:hypothetical protein